MKTISFVIPCYNEEKRISKTFKALTRVMLPPGLKLAKIIFVNDGSTDKTFDKIQRWISEQPSISSNKLSVISYASNRGKGCAIRKGMLESKADYTLFFDADISTPLSEITKFLPFIQKNVDVIVGTRKNGKSTVLVHQPIYRELLGRAFTQIARLFLRVNVTDFTCGFKAFSRRSVKTIFPKAKISGWAYDAEILFLAQMAGFTIKEAAITWSNDESTRVRLGSAIIKTLWELVQIRSIHGSKPVFGLPVFNFKFAKNPRTRTTKGK